MHIDDADAGGSLKSYKIDVLTMARWWATIIKEHHFFAISRRYGHLCGVMPWLRSLTRPLAWTHYGFCCSLRKNDAHWSHQRWWVTKTWKIRFRDDIARLWSRVWCCVLLVWSDKSSSVIDIVSQLIYFEKMRTNYWTLITHYWRFSLAFGVLRSRVWRDMAVAQRKH